MAFTRSIYRSVTFVVAAVTAGALAIGVPATATADTRPVAPTPATVAVDGLPTVQIDGVVWSQAVVGNTVYAGGSFTTARPAGAAAGTNTVSRPYLLAYDIRTGELISSFAPVLNAQVRSIAASPDGSRIYVAGDFTTVNGVARNRIAAFDTATGALITSFNASLAYNANAVTVGTNAVYVGGNFGAAKGQTRGRLAAFSPTNGDLLNWAPVADGGGYQVDAMAMSPDQTKVIVGGRFTTLNGVTQYGLGAIDANTGALAPWTAPALIKNAGTKAGISGITTQGDTTYLTGFVFGSEAGIPKGNLEGVAAVDGNSGAIKWIQDCHGDTYQAFEQGDAVYSVSHAHDCRNIGAFPDTSPTTWHRANAVTKAATGTVKTNTVSGYYNYGGQPAPTWLHFDPHLAAGTYTGQTQAAWSVTGNDQYVVMGGEFPRVNFKDQQGLVRFAVSSVAPNKVGPDLQTTEMNPQLSAPSSNWVHGSFAANYDPDNEALTYRVFRQDVTGPIAQLSARSSFWNRPVLGFNDSSVTAGQTYNYRVQTLDPFGNIKYSEWTPITVPASGTISPYGKAVLGDNPTTYWRLGEASGGALNSAGGAAGTVGTGVTRGAAGAIVGDADKAATFNGTSNGRVSTPTATAGPQQFTVEAWFKTNSTRGGKIIGFGSSASGNSSSYDRHIYLRNNGQVTFGVYPGAVKTVTSPNSYNNNQWHQVVGTLSATSGMALYVDGQKVASDATVTTAQAYNGYWRVGGDALSSWPSVPSSTYVSGTIDEVSIYNSPLSDLQISQHYADSGNGAAVPNTPPTAAFSADMATPLTGSYDAGNSSDPDGSITGYRWDFGDGTSDNGVTATHKYATAGTYAVTLTVTDNDGATTTLTKNVDVAPPPNVKPTAAFSTSITGLTVGVNGSASTDSDGTVTSYDWDFGDGAAGSGATADHTYAAAGTYQVKLTVTDNRGGTDSLTKDVTVASDAATAKDAFARSVTGGWGVADLGGTWSLTGGAANFAVANGVGTQTAAAGGTRSAFLPDVSQNSAETQATVSLDKAATGGGNYVTVQGRRIDSANYYGAKIRVLATGAVTAILAKTVASTETTLASATVSGLTYQAGDKLRLRVQVDGTNPTTVRMKVWKDGTTEPTAWLLTTTDATAALQAKGSVGLMTYVSGSATNAPVTAAFDDLWVGLPRP